MIRGERDRQPRLPHGTLASKQANGSKDVVSTRTGGSGRPSARLDLAPLRSELLDIRQQLGVCWMHRRPLR
jgi:hypothetical protein